MRRFRRLPPRPRVAVAPPAAAWSAFDGLTTTDHYLASTPVLPGAASGFHVQAWIYLEAAGSSATRTFLGTNGSGGAAGGWLLLTRTTHTTLEFAVVDGTATTRFAPTYAIQPADIGRPLHVCGWRDATHIRFAVDGVEVGSGTAITGHTAATANLGFGARPAASQSPGGLIRLIGASGGTSIPSGANIAAAYSAGMSALDVVDIAGATFRYSAALEGVAGATVTDRVGSATLTRVGAPTFVVA